MFHIIKICRTYSGEGYRGPSCEWANIEPGKTYSTLKEAKEDMVKLNEVNPVGWRIMNTLTMEEVSSFESWKHAEE